MHKELEAHAELPLPRAKGMHWPVCSMSIPERIASSRFGGQDFTYLSYKDGAFVSANQRPSNGGCWRVNSRSLTEKSHDRVQAVGEIHHEATHQARQSSGGLIAHGVALHLSVASRGAILGSTIVFTSFMHNPTFKADAYRRGLTPR